MPIIEVSDGATISTDRLEMFARVIDGCIRPGWAVFGNEFMFSAELPWQARWHGLTGSAEEKLAAFDPKLADKLKRRELTLQAAKRILLQRDCDAIAKYRVAQFREAAAPYLTFVPRFLGRNHVPYFLILKCPCGAKWERLSFFACENWYWVSCPTCGGQHSFRMLPEGEGFESRPTPVNEHAAIAGGALNKCIPIRELEEAA